MKWRTKPSLYDEFNNNILIKELRRHSDMNNYINQYISSDPKTREVILDQSAPIFYIYKILSLSQMFELSTLFDKIKNYPTPKESNKIPIFTESIKTKIRNSMRKICVSEIKDGMVLCMPYNRIIYNDIITEQGRIMTHSIYQDVFIFGIKNKIPCIIPCLPILEIETYTCYEEYNNHERRIIYAAGIDTKIEYSHGGWNHMGAIAFKGTLCTHNDQWCKDTGECINIITYDLYHVPNPEQYIESTNTNI
jgi:hypothetical protein